MSAYTGPAPYDLALPKCPRCGCYTVNWAAHKNTCAAQVKAQTDEKPESKP